MESEYQAQGTDGARCRSYFTEEEGSYFTEDEKGERFLMVHQKTKKPDNTTDKEDNNDPLAAAEEGGPFFGPFDVYVLFAWILILGYAVFSLIPVGRGG